MANVLRRDRKATAEFVSHCADCVYPCVHRRLVPRTDAVEDLMQEILLAAWQHLPEFRGEPGWEPGFSGSRDIGLKIITANAFGKQKCKRMNHHRANPRSARIEMRLDDEALRQRVDVTLRQLPEPYGLALLWRYRDEKSVREIAELAGKTEKAVERLLARAPKNFKKRWNDDHPR